MNNKRKTTRIKFSGILCLLALLLVIPLFSPQYYLHLAIIVFINIILATSARICLTAGLFNVGLAGFVAIGAYTSALLVVNLGLPFEIGLISGGLLSMLISIVLGIPSLRLTKGIYFALVTVAFGEVVRATANK
ncbi:branched-chain amino acid ABC transporter permease, partial [Chloroflexota bacterium]